MDRAKFKSLAIFGIHLSIVILVISIGLTGGVSGWYYSGVTAGGDNWDIPERASVTTLDDGEYINLWYDITTYSDNQRQHRNLRNDLNDNTDVDITDENITTVLDFRDRDPRSFTHEPIPETETWNDELTRKNGDIITHISDDNKEKAESDGQTIITKTGVETLSLDPHTNYITEDEDSGQFEDRIRYIGEDGKLILASNDFSTSSRSTESHNSWPYTRRTTYSIKDVNVEKEIIIDHEGETHELADSFPSGVEDVRFSLPDDVEAGDEITFNVRYFVEAVEMQRDQSRSASARTTRRCRYSTNSEGETTRNCRTVIIGWNYGSWSTDSTTRHSHTVEVEDEITATYYEPELDITYDVEETDGQSTYLMEIEHANNQPIAGLTPQQDFTDTSIQIQDIIYPNSFYSVSNQQYRNTFGSDGILPVEHVGMPTQERPTTRDKNVTNVNIIDHDGNRAAYPNPDDVSFPIEASYVIETDEIRFLDFRSRQFDENDIHIQPIMPDANVNKNIEETDSEISGQDIQIVDLEIEKEEIEDGVYELTLITTDPETGERISTEDSENSKLDMRNMPDTDEQYWDTEHGHPTFDREDDGTINYTANMTPPTYASAQVTPVDLHHDDGELDEDDVIYVSNRAEIRITHNPDIDSTSTMLTILTRLVEMMLWYLFPIAVLLSLITKGLTGKWTPWYDF